MTVIDTRVRMTSEELVVLASKIIEAFPNGIALENITLAISECMTIVGQIQKLSGADKKQLVIDMLIYIVKNTDSGLMEVMDPVIIYAVPDIIDYFIKVEKGKLRFNQTISNRLKFFPCC